MKTKYSLFFLTIILMLSLNNLSAQKNFFLDISGNYSSYLSTSEEEETKFDDYISTYGANAGASFYFTKKYSDFILGADVNYQYERFHSNTKFDNFDTKNPFDLFTTSAGAIIGFKFDGGSNFNYEIMAKGGLIINSFVEQKIESDIFQILTTKPYGKYVEGQFNLVNDNGNGFFGSVKFWFDKKIDSNLDAIFSINDFDFDIPSTKYTFRVGYRVGLF